VWLMEDFVDELVTDYEKKMTEIRSHSGGCLFLTGRGGNLKFIYPLLANPYHCHGNYFPVIAINQECPFRRGTQSTGRILHNYAISFHASSLC